MWWTWQVKKSGSEGMRFQEATNINRSLLAFGMLGRSWVDLDGENVVSALAARKSHVPLRDSKLTRSHAGATREEVTELVVVRELKCQDARLTKILDGSIGGNCRTALLVCVNPAFEHVGETLNTLEFASRAMRVEAFTARSARDFALRKQSAEAAEQAKKEAERREKAVQEAEGHVKKLQQAKRSGDQCSPGEPLELLWTLRFDRDIPANAQLQLQETREVVGVIPDAAGDLERRIVVIFAEEKSEDDWDILDRLQVSEELPQPLKERFGAPEEARSPQWHCSRVVTSGQFPVTTSLAEYLRYHLGLTGTKIGCGEDSDVMRCVFLMNFAYLCIMKNWKLHMV
eukprot:Skav201972  [mRNA]  locus=scaffold103:324565:333231:+ [translate_table: standard]